MNFGKKLKDLRLQKAVTQEQFAAYLNLSPQAVSKWENNLTLPDIQLLPEISVYFGVTIDELFDLTDQKHLQRIENMLDTKRTIDKADFEYAQSFLQNKLLNPQQKPRCLTLLSALYNLKADEYSSLAEYYAKEALVLEPENKDNHVNLRTAQHGTFADWDFYNHSRRISYYQEFVAQNPDYPRGYLWLLDELIADNRLEEAIPYFQKALKLQPSPRYTDSPVSIALIYEIQGKYPEAIRAWEDVIRLCQEEWHFTDGEEAIERPKREIARLRKLSAR